jgi:hypothetical protein
MALFIGQNKNRSKTKCCNLLLLSIGSKLKGHSSNIILAPLSHAHMLHETCVQLEMANEIT